MTDETGAADAASESTAAPSSHEAISAAFEKVGFSEEPAPAAETSEAPAADVTAEAGEGQPVETPMDAPKQARGPDGKFVKADEPAQEAAEPAKEAEEAPAAKEDAKPRVEAPARFSADAKEAWKDTPPEVQSEITRAMDELQRGLEGYQERFAPMKRHFDRAEAEGVDLAHALDRYIQIETALAANPLQGMENLARSMGTSLQQIAAHYAGQTPDQQSAARDQEIGRLNRELNDLRAQMGQTHQTAQKTAEAQQMAQVQAQIDAFKVNAPRLDELGEQVADLISRGFDLAEAYSMADRLNPVPASAPSAAPAAAQTRETPVPAQTRDTSKLSISGASGPGQSASLSPAASSTEAVHRAFSRAGLI